MVAKYISTPKVTGFRYQNNTLKAHHLNEKDENGK